LTIIGHGVDLISVPRVVALLQRNDEFLHGWFSVEELTELETTRAGPESIAGRVVAKEAIVKALGTGFNDTVSWQDVEVFATESGETRVVLSSGARDVAVEKGVNKVLVSITHTREIAFGSAILVG